MKRFKIGKGLVLGSGLCLLASSMYGCGKDEEFTIGGAVSGMSAGEGIVLQNNNGDDLTKATSGTLTFFTFSRKLEEGDGYNVRVKVSPGEKFCTVQNGMGVVDENDVTSIKIICIP